MARLLYDLTGVRGRSMKLYDTKCVINTTAGIGSFMTGNSTDGEKTIFLKDVVGVQFKKSASLIGYLQFETPSMQMNNSNSNMFSENTFTFEAGKNGITNEFMESLYHYVVDRIEELKYGPAPSYAPAAIPAQSNTPATTPGAIECPICHTRQIETNTRCCSCGQPFIRG